VGQTILAGQIDFKVCLLLLLVSKLCTRVHKIYRWQKEYVHMHSDELANYEKYVQSKMSGDF